MNETHQARAPTIPHTGRPNREPLDTDEVISYALVLAGDLGVSIPKRKRLCREMCLRAAPCCFQIQPRRTALRGEGKPQGVIGLEALHGASGRDELPPRF